MTAEILALKTTFFVDSFLPALLAYCLNKQVFKLCNSKNNGFLEKVLFSELYSFVPLIALGTNSEYT